MELLRRCVSPSLKHIAVLVACLAGLAAAVSDLPEADLTPQKPLPTRFEQAMAETAALSPDARARLHAARLSEQMLLVHDEVDDVSDGEAGEESDNDSGEGHRRKLGRAAKKLGLKPPLLNSGPIFSVPTPSPLLILTLLSHLPPIVLMARRAVRELLDHRGRRFRLDDVGDHQQHDAAAAVAAAGVRLRDEAVLQGRLARLGLLLYPL
ncbi:unnamed protein product [Closterium sp. Naga37s-1]|nr:unnamed protein product [Closterium sp. Naga37s-1]